MPKSVKFLPLKDALTQPEYLITDFAKFERPAQLHVGFQALDQFLELKGQLPRPWNEEDAAKVLELAKTINDAREDKVELDTGLMKKLSFIARGDVAPMCAVIGGLVAQEVLKVNFTRKLFFLFVCF
jgi:ubiquitin-activating enzyme E1